MNNENIEERFDEILKYDKLVCTQDELDIFQNYGYLIFAGDKFITRKGKHISVEVINQIVKNMNINLSKCISSAIEISKRQEYSRVYIMSEKLYKKYYIEGRIVEKGKSRYFKSSEGELWLVNLV